MSDDDFLPSAQFTQHRSSQQAVTSTSRVQAWDMPGPSRGPGTSRGPGASRDLGSSRGPGASQSQPSQEELSQIQDRLILLMDRVEQLTGNSRGIKRPADQKSYDKKPDTKEQCQICKKPYANKTTLFRHYRAIHQEMNPEKYHGCSINSTVVSLDMSFRENTCAICGYVATNQNALDAHNRAVHSNVVSVNPNNNAVNGTDFVVASVSNKENVNNNVINRMHKCEECAGYFEKRNELDEHMKVQHGFEVVCKICNKNLLFKDYNAHVKDSHPDVYKKNEKIEKVIIEKVMRNKKGDRVHVFICTECDIKMVDKREAEKHAIGHKKGLKIKIAPRNKVSKAKENLTSVTPNTDLIILTCEACDISTDSYDAAVEHSQNHITSNSNHIQFVTQQCLICELKFEPLCYKKHIDLHYNNKEIRKESFIYFKYRFQILLSENWFACFNTSVIEDMLCRSIYEHTRSVKMRVTREGIYKLYKCCQCDNFVEPAAVLSHTINYDTCVKIKRSRNGVGVTCDVCQRNFSNKLARDNHAKDHKNEEDYKTVLFNHEQDKDLNKILNDPNITHGLNNDADANAPNVLYKCLCGLCFVRKENADKHKQICPGKDPKKTCPKCSNMFNLEELLIHCFEHHLNGTRIVIENISPDAIVIDSDDDDVIIEIDSSDEDEAQTERFTNIKTEILKGNDATAVRGSSEGAKQAEKQNMNASENAITETSENIEVASGETLLIEKSEKGDEDEDRCDDDFGGVDHEMTEENSQDTIACENTDTDVANPASNRNNHENFKCVPMNLLLNPFHFENCFLNAEITAGTKIVRQQIETTDACVRFDTKIKQERSWLFDPTDFSNIRSRRSLRQIEVQPASVNLSQEIVELLLTDDEEAEMNNDEDDTQISDNVRSDENNDIVNERTGNNYMREDLSNNISNTPMTQNVGAVVEILNDVSHTTNNEDITPINEINGIEGSVGENNVNCEDEHSELTESNSQRVDINDATHSFQGEAGYNENNDQDHSYNDDDLFVSSGILNREQPQNTELDVNEMPNNPLHEEPVVAQVASTNNKTSVNIENIPEENTRIRVENPLDDPEINENRSEENDIDNTNANQEIVDENNASTEHVQSNYEDTQDLVESTPMETSSNEIDASTEHVQSNYEDPQDFVESTPNEAINGVINDIAEDVASTKELSKKTDINIKKEFGYININIKRENENDENEHETENGGDKLVRIKTEPKENYVFVGNNTDDINYNHCTVC